MISVGFASEPGNCCVHEQQSHQLNVYFEECHERMLVVSPTIFEGGVTNDTDKV